MEKETEKVEKVEELANFPFKTFQEFNTAYFEGIAQPGVDRSVALNWAQNGIYTSKFLRIQTAILTLLPFLAAIGFIVYAIISKSWLLLLALPLLFIGFFIFHPSSAMVFGFIRTGFIGLTFIGFIWALITGKSKLLALTITLLLIWYTQKTIYKKAVNSLVDALTKHEDLLCFLWQGRALNIRFYNRNLYWVDHKFENGKYINYEK